MFNSDYSNHLISSWNNLKCIALLKFYHTKAAKAATGKPAAKSIAVLPVDEDEELDSCLRLPMTQ